MNGITTAAFDVCVLVVDDVEPNLIATSALLERPGVRVLTAASGEQALEVLLGNDIAVALVDVQMPSMDGFSLAELMRGSPRTRNVPIIFLTAASEERQRVFRGYEAGAVDFLHKPLDPRVLQSKVEVFVELARQRRELQQLVRLNETMAAVLAHDLRTPLSAIMTCAEVVMRAGSEGPVLQAGSRIKSSGARMARMIDQLLDFARLRSGAIELQRREVALRRLIESALAEVRQARPNVDIALHHDGSDDVAMVDADRISQVLVNLFDNAARHGDGGRIDVALRDASHGRVAIAVGNRGAIPPERRGDLFAPFRSGQGSSGNAGLGLGLYIVDQFVRAHGGRVQANTGPDHTEFVLELPRRG